MSGVRAEAQEAGCRMPGGQVGAEFITLSNQKRLPTPFTFARADFVAVVKREDDVRPISPVQDFMRTGGAFDVPSEAEKRGENTGGLRRGPMAHAAMNETFSSSSGTASSCSRRSAIARRARAWTAAIAAAFVCP